MEELSVVKKNFINYTNHIIQNHKVSHAYLIEIDSYEKDFPYVLNFIKMILCDISYEEVDSSSDPILSLIDQNNYPDIKIIEPDGNMIKKSQLLELQQDYSNKSLLNGKKIYIIKEAEKLNSSSANTMLKFLEEPEENIIAFLLTDNRYHVLETLISRCQILNLREDSFIFEKDEKLLELLKCMVHPRDFLLKYNYFLSEVIVDKEMAKEKFVEIENIIIGYFHKNCGLLSDFDESIVLLLQECSEQKLLSCLSILEEEILKLDYNVNYKLWLDSLFSRLIINGG